MNQPLDFADVFHTELGWIASIGRDDVLKLLAFGYDSPQQAMRQARRLWPGELALHSWFSELSVRLQAFAVGVKDDFLDIQLDLSHLGAFERKVIKECRRIPAGTTLSYAELARRSGSAQAARAVGNVMAKNRFPLVVPCHRVVRSGGGLGGYSARHGLRVKRRLLELEGCGAELTASMS